MQPRRHGSPFLGLRIPDPGRGNTATCAHRVSSMDGAAWLQFILSVILKGGHLAADTAVRETWVRSPGLGRSPGEGNGNRLQCSCLENPMDGGAWWATGPRGRKESDTTEQLHFHFHCCPEAACPCSRSCSWSLNGWVVGSEFH